MFIHNLKIAFRNLWKYKSQTLINVIGLAVGFTCFALATLWIRYEMTFDSFHKNAKQMYVVYVPYKHNNSGISKNTPEALANYLKETFPEIEDATTISPSSPGIRVKVNGLEFPVSIISVDSSFFQMLDVKILEGNIDYRYAEMPKLAITQEKARQWFGNENPTGKTISFGENLAFSISAVVSGFPKQSNYPFDIIIPDTRGGSDSWNYYGSGETIIKLSPGTNVKAFKKKFYEHEINKGEVKISKMTLTPLTKVRYTDPNIEREVKFQHIVVFSLSGFLVILCSLFNYLTLFVSRFRMRQKELALRVVSGASGSSLLVMLSVEFMLTLLFAVVLGYELTQWVHEPFLALSEIQIDSLALYLELFMYTGSVILVSLLVFWLILLIFRHRSLNLSIRRNKTNLSRKISVITQLVISIGFAFCTCVILKQLYFLHHSEDLGFSFLNRGSVMIWDLSTNGDGVLENHLKQMPEITEVHEIDGAFDIISGYTFMLRYKSWDGKPVDVDEMEIATKPVSPEYADFYNLRLLAGEMLTDDDPTSLILINESMAKALGWHDPVGKHINGYTVKGVIKNIYNKAPTIEAKPILFIKSQKMQMVDGKTQTRSAIFKYRKGMGDTVKEKIEQFIKKEYAGLEYRIHDTEEEYNKFLKSENALIKLLSFVSAICILICVFGFVSLVSLTCEERRKSIAIRKINGATAGDILAIFAKEYFLLLIIGAVIAFPAGYIIMQRWLEQYVKQTSIPAWIYLSILLVLVLIIVLCVGWRVYRSSVENPAEVVKKE